MLNTLQYNKDLIKDISQTVIDGRTSQPTITFTPFIITIGGYDVCFAMVVKLNKSQGLYKQGINSQQKSLVVSVMNISSICFSLDGSEKYPSYVQEKLGLPQGETSNDIAELINYIQELSNADQ
jgi:hypothetical protein